MPRCPSQGRARTLARAQIGAPRGAQVHGVPREKGPVAGEACRRSVPALCILSRDKKWSLPEKESGTACPSKLGHLSPRPKWHRSGGPSETHENGGDSEQAAGPPHAPASGGTETCACEAL